MALLCPLSLSPSLSRARERDGNDIDANLASLTFLLSPQITLRTTSVITLRAYVVYTHILSLSLSLSLSVSYDTIPDTIASNASAYSVVIS